MRAAAVLLLIAAAAPAWAGFTLEIDPRTESFASRAACEQALEIRHSAALARFAALPAKERRGSRVEALTRSGGDLAYLEILDLSADSAEAGMPRRQTETLACRGSTLEHRIDYEAGEN
ncbi:MAG TPA: hypothetical protein VF574_00470 [Allosphingosinicella sp.]